MHTIQCTVYDVLDDHAWPAELAGVCCLGFAQRAAALGWGARRGQKGCARGVWRSAVAEESARGLCIGFHCSSRLAAGLGGLQGCRPLADGPCPCRSDAPPRSALAGFSVLKFLCWPCKLALPCPGLPCPNLAPPCPAPPCLAMSGPAPPRPAPPCPTPHCPELPS